MTTSGHHQIMERVRIAELKASLSRYLAKVRGGERMIVCDRNTPIAWLTPYDGEGDDFSVISPTLPAAELRRMKTLKLRSPVDVVELLRESRDQR